MKINKSVTLDIEVLTKADSICKATQKTLSEVINDLCLDGIKSFDAAQVHAQAIAKQVKK